MTTPQGPAQPAPKVKKRLKVEPAPGGRLEQFLIQNKTAHDDAEVAGEREDETKAAIKAYLISLYPDGNGMPDAFDITADPHGRYPGYTMSLKGGSHLSSEAMPEELVTQLERYRVPNKPSWELRESSAGRRRR